MSPGEDFDETDKPDHEYGLVPAPLPDPWDGGEPKWAIPDETNGKKSATPDQSDPLVSNNRGIPSVPLYPYEGDPIPDMTKPPFTSPNENLASANLQGRQIENGRINGDRILELVLEENAESAIHLPELIQIYENLRNNNVPVSKPNPEGIVSYLNSKKSGLIDLINVGYPGIENRLSEIEIGYSPEDNSIKIELEDSVLINFLYDSNRNSGSSSIPRIDYSFDESDLDLWKQIVFEKIYELTKSEDMPVRNEVILPPFNYMLIGKKDEEDIFSLPATSRSFNWGARFWVGSLIRQSGFEASVEAYYKNSFNIAGIVMFDDIWKDIRIKAKKIYSQEQEASARVVPVLPTANKLLEGETMEESAEEELIEIPQSPLVLGESLKTDSEEVSTPIQILETEMENRLKSLASNADVMNGNINTFRTFTNREGTEITPEVYIATIRTLIDEFGKDENKFIKGVFQDVYVMLLEQHDKDFFGSEYYDKVEKSITIFGREYSEEELQQIEESENYIATLKEDYGHRLRNSYYVEKLLRLKELDPLAYAEAIYSDSDPSTSNEPRGLLCVQNFLNQENRKYNLNYIRNIASVNVMRDIQLGTSDDELIPDLELFCDLEYFQFQEFRNELNSLLGIRFPYVRTIIRTLNKYRALSGDESPSPYNDPDTDAFSMNKERNLEIRRWQSDIKEILSPHHVSTVDYVPGENENLILDRQFLKDLKPDQFTSFIRELRSMRSTGQVRINENLVLTPEQASSLIEKYRTRTQDQSLEGKEDTSQHEATVPEVPMEVSVKEALVTGIRRELERPGNKFERAYIRYPTEDLVNELEVSDAPIIIDIFSKTLTAFLEKLDDPDSPLSIEDDLLLSQLREILKRELSSDETAALEEAHEYIKSLESEDSSKRIKDYLEAHIKFQISKPEKYFETLLAGKKGVEADFNQWNVAVNRDILISYGNKQNTEENSITFVLQKIKQISFLEDVPWKNEALYNLPFEQFEILMQELETEAAKLDLKALSTLNSGNPITRVIMRVGGVEGANNEIINRCIRIINRYLPANSQTSTVLSTYPEIGSPRAIKNIELNELAERRRKELFYSRQIELVVLNKIENENRIRIDEDREFIALLNPRQYNSLLKQLKKTKEDPTEAIQTANELALSLGLGTQRFKTPNEWKRQKEGVVEVKVEELEQVPKRGPIDFQFRNEAEQTLFETRRNALLSEIPFELFLQDVDLDSLSGGNRSDFLDSVLRNKDLLVSLTDSKFNKFVQDIVSAFESTKFINDDEVDMRDFEIRLRALVDALDPEDDNIQAVPGLPQILAPSDQAEEDLELQETNLTLEVGQTTEEDNAQSAVSEITDQSTQRALEPEAIFRERQTIIHSMLQDQRIPYGDTPFQQDIYNNEELLAGLSEDELAELSSDIDALKEDVYFVGRLDFERLDSGLNRIRDKWVTRKAAKPSEDLGAQNINTNPISESDAASSTDLDTTTDTSDQEIEDGVLELVDQIQPIADQENLPLLTRQELVDAKELAMKRFDLLRRTIDRKKYSSKDRVGLENIENMMTETINLISDSFENPNVDENLLLRRVNDAYRLMINAAERDFEVIRRAGGEPRQDRLNILEEWKEGQSIIRRRLAEIQANRARVQLDDKESLPETKLPVIEANRIEVNQPVIRNLNRVDVEKIKDVEVPPVKPDTVIERIKKIAKPVATTVAAALLLFGVGKGILDSSNKPLNQLPQNPGLPAQVANAPTQTPIVIPTETDTSTATNTATVSPTPSVTPSPSATLTQTQLPTSTETLTPIPTLSPLSNSTTTPEEFNAQAAATEENVFTETATPSATSTLTATSTTAPTKTDEPSATFTQNATLTTTPSPTLTMTPSSTPAPSGTPVPPTKISTNTLTPTLIGRDIPTLTAFPQRATQTSEAQDRIDFRATQITGIDNANATAEVQTQQAAMTATSESSLTPIAVTETTATPGSSATGLFTTLSAPGSQANAQVPSTALPTSTLSSTAEIVQTVEANAQAATEEATEFFTPTPEGLATETLNPPTASATTEVASVTPAASATLTPAASATQIINTPIAPTAQATVTTTLSATPSAPIVVSPTVIAPVNPTPIITPVVTTPAAPATLTPESPIKPDPTTIPPVGSYPGGEDPDPSTIPLEQKFFIGNREVSVSEAFNTLQVDRVNRTGVSPAPLYIPEGDYTLDNGKVIKVNESIPLVGGNNFIGPLRRAYQMGAFGPDVTMQDMINLMRDPKFQGAVIRRNPGAYKAIVKS